MNNPVTLLAISGSSRKDSSNVLLIQRLIDSMPERNIEFCPTIYSLPLFAADLDCHPWPEQVLVWRKKIKESKALIVSTPSYLYNLPAVIKNALEWLASSGELNEKPVIPITFTPNAPRGENAMTSLCWSLKALNARILPTLSIYQTENPKVDGKIELDEVTEEMLREVLGQV